MALHDHKRKQRSHRHQSSHHHHHHKKHKRRKHHHHHDETKKDATVELDERTLREVLHSMDSEILSLVSSSDGDLSFGEEKEKLQVTAQEERGVVAGLSGDGASHSSSLTVTTHEIGHSRLVIASARDALRQGSSDEESVEQTSECLNQPLQEEQDITISITTASLPGEEPGGCTSRSSSRLKWSSLYEKVSSSCTGPASPSGTESDLSNDSDHEQDTPVRHFSNSSLDDSSQTGSPLSVANWCFKDSRRSSRSRSRSHSQERCEQDNQEHSKRLLHSRHRNASHKKISRDRDQSHSQDKSRYHRRDRDRYRSRDRDRYRSRDRNQYHSRDRDQHRSRGRDQHRSRDRDQYHSRDRDQHHSRGRDRYHSRDRNRYRRRVWNRSRSKDRNQSHRNIRNRSYSRSRSRSRSRDGSRSYRRRRDRSRKSRSRSYSRSKRRHGRSHSHEHDNRTDSGDSSSDEKNRTRSQTGVEDAQHSTCSPNKQLIGSAMPTSADGKQEKIAQLTDFCRQLAGEKGDAVVDQPLVHPFEIGQQPSLVYHNNSWKTPSQMVLESNAASMAGKEVTEIFPFSSGVEHQKQELVHTVTGTAGESLPVSELVMLQLQTQHQFLVSPLDPQAKTAFEQAEKWCKSQLKVGQFTSQPGLTPLTKAHHQQGIQAWARKNMFHGLAPVMSGFGMRMLKQMGWTEGSALGRSGSGRVEPIELNVKVDRQGLATQQDSRTPIIPAAVLQASGKLVPACLQGKHPVSALQELCTRKHWDPPLYELVSSSGKSHNMTFLYQVAIPAGTFRPSCGSNSKKTAKAQAAICCLTSLGLMTPNESSLGLDSQPNLTGTTVTQNQTSS